MALLWIWLARPKSVEVPLGRVADFCPLCRFVKPFVVHRVELTHVTGRVIGAERMFRRCTSCRVELEYDPRRYRAVVNVKTDDLGALIAETFPDVQTRLEQRLSLERRIREAPESLRPSERADLIRESLLLVAPQILENKSGDDARGVHRGLTLTFLMLLLLALTASGTHGGMGSMLARALPVLLFGLGYAGAKAISGSRERLHSGLALLARALRPLRPTHGELQQALDALGKPHRKLRRRLDVDRIERALAAPQLAPPDDVPPADPGSRP